MRISNKRDLPKWFSLKSYEVFTLLSDEEIFFQMLTRAFAYAVGNNQVEGYFDNPIKDISVISMEHITGEKDDPDAELLSVGPCRRLAEGIAVKPLTALDAFSITNMLNELSITESGDDHDGMMNDERTHISLLNTETSSKNVICSISLIVGDDFIISSLKSVLPLWRKQLSVPELKGEEVKTSWEIIRHKIISYQAFAFYDLMQWQKISGNKITTSVLAAALYPDGEYGEIAINQTIKSFVEKIFSEKSLVKFMSEFSDKAIFD